MVVPATNQRRRQHHVVDGALFGDVGDQLGDDHLRYNCHQVRMAMLHAAVGAPGLRQALHHVVSYAVGHGIFHVALDGFTR